MNQSSHTAHLEPIAKTIKPHIYTLIGSWQHCWISQKILNKQTQWVRAYVELWLNRVSNCQGFLQRSASTDFVWVSLLWNVLTLMRSWIILYFSAKRLILNSPSCGSWAQMAWRRPSHTGHTCTSCVRRVRPGCARWVCPCAWRWRHTGHT